MLKMLPDRVAAVILKDKKILLVTGYGETVYWTPGGKLDEKESRESCLRRELFEELGIRLVKMKYYMTYMNPSYTTPEGKTGMQRSHCYFVKYGGRVKPKGEITKTTWYSGKDFEKRKPKLFKGIYENLVARLVRDGFL